MNIAHCPACGFSNLAVREYSELLSVRGAQVTVNGLYETQCTQCGFEFTTSEQHDANVALVKATHSEQAVRVKVEKGLLTGEELREIRLNLGLTQKQAAELFGGGPVAFSKYESDEVAQSVAMDRLVRLVAHMGPFGLDRLRAVIGGPALAHVSSASQNIAFFAEEVQGRKVAHVDIAPQNVIVFKSRPAKKAMGQKPVTATAGGAQTFEAAVGLPASQLIH